MSQIVIEDNLFAQLQRKAVGSGADIESLAHEAIQRYLQGEEEQKMQQEIGAPAGCSSRHSAPGSM